jgi:hypothetical protein
MNIGSINSKENKKMPVVKKRRSRFFSCPFWDAVFCKLIETFISVKLWILFSTFGFCSWGLIKGYITGNNASAILVATIAPIVVMREGFKIAKVRDIGKTIRENTDMDVKENEALNKIQDMSN